MTHADSYLAFPEPLNDFSFEDFTAVLGSQKNWELQGVPNIPWPHTCTAVLTVSIQHQNYTFVSMDEPIFTCDYHLKFIVYIRVLRHECLTNAEGYISITSLALNNIQLFVHNTVVCLFTYRRTPWLPPSFGNMNKAAMNNCVQVFVWT